MPYFPVALAPSAQKVRGAYYTPHLIASFLANWVTEEGGCVLEPSCGDGAFLHALGRSGASVTGVEIEEGEANKARTALPTAEIITADFFEWFTPHRQGSWDGVAGNPPFIRFGNWAAPSRDLALDLMRSTGMRPTKLTNAWVPFVVASALALRRGGRLGMVIPAELLQVGYAAELRGYLVDHFTELTAVAFNSLVFDGIQQEVILLLGVRGDGPARIRLLQVEDAASLPSLEGLEKLPHAPALQHETEKWTKYFLDPAGIDALRAARSAGLPKLGEIASIDVGIVTGRNQFFVLRPSVARERHVEGFVVPLVSKSAHLRGVAFSLSDFDALVKADAACGLLALSPDHDPVHPGLTSYIDAGEAEQVHLGYKCSIRKKWWSVPSQWRPDAFLLRQIHDHPRIIANGTAATSTDTIHRVRMLNGLSPAKLAAASVNSLTFAFSEVLGRSYGGGVLELEPREAEALPFPDAHLLASSDVDLIDELVRAGKLVEALDFVDRVVLIGGHGLDAELVGALRGVWERLRDRRLVRNRGTRSRVKS